MSHVQWFENVLLHVVPERLAGDRLHQVAEVVEALPAHTLRNGSAVRNLSGGGGPMSLTLWKGPGHPVISIYRQAPETMISGRKNWPDSYRSFGLKRATNLAQIRG